MTSATALDVVVLGGGPAGAAAAIALAHGGASVAVLDRPAPPERPRIGETVPPSVVGPLARLGVWDAFRADDHLAAPGTIACWGADQRYENEFIFSPYGNGWHLDRGRFDASLLRAAADSGAVIHRLAAGDQLVPDGSAWCAHLGGRRLRAPLIVDATGRAARIGQRHGARPHRVDRLIGLVRFGPATHPEPRTILEATAHGWWYAAVLPRARAVTVFFTDADLLPVGAAQRERHWVQELARTQLVSGIMATAAATRIHIAVARTSALSRCAGANWLAIGDAARTLDPLSGQGLEAAMNSAIRAADAVLGHGRTAALKAFSERTVEEHHHHLRVRQAHYDRERRWAHNRFWLRRHTSGRAGSGSR